MNRSRFIALISTCFGALLAGCTTPKRKPFIAKLPPGLERLKTIQHAKLKVAQTQTVVTISGKSTLVLSWTGGGPPFQLLKSTSLTSNVWTKIGNPTMARTTSLPNDGARMVLFRVQAYVPLLTATRDSVTHLTWSAPDLT